MLTNSILIQMQLKNVVVEGIVCNSLKQSNREASAAFVSRVHYHLSDEIGRPCIQWLLRALTTADKQPLTTEHSTYHCDLPVDKDKTQRSCSLKKSLNVFLLYLLGCMIKTVQRNFTSTITKEFSNIKLIAHWNDLARSYNTSNNFFYLLNQMLYLSYNSGSQMCLTHLLTPQPIPMVSNTFSLEE